MPYLLLKCIIFLIWISKSISCAHEGALKKNGAKCLNEIPSFLDCSGRSHKSGPYFRLIQSAVYKIQVNDT